MTLPIYQVDAFADAVFKGNPAAVVPLQQWLDESLMQSIAAENNLSETAFIVNEGGSQQWAVRWFTPDYEIDLCGHATLASAYVIKKFLQNDVTEIHFSTQKAGALKVLIQDDVLTLDFPSRPPQPCATPENLFAALGITEAMAVLKSRDYFVVLKDENAVRSVKPDFSLLQKLDAIGVIVSAQGKEYDAVSRCFYPGAGVPEDPVTGSAHCNIVPYWAGKLNKNTLRCLQASARSGVLNCELNGDRVLMSGKCVLFLEGIIHL